MAPPPTQLAKYFFNFFFGYIYPPPIRGRIFIEQLRGDLGKAFRFRTHRVRWAQTVHIGRHCLIAPAIIGRPRFGPEAKLTGHRWPKNKTASEQRCACVRTERPTKLCTFRVVVKGIIYYLIGRATNDNYRPTWHLDVRACALNGH